jgi:nucleoside-diphosphate-sugar epimerase
MSNRHVGVLGARSLVGECLLPALLAAGWKVNAFSRQPMASDRRDIEWRRLPANDPEAACRIEHWISLAPIWLLPRFFPLLERYGARRIVALSSTSRFVKIESADARERELAALLADGEQHLQGWAESTGRQWLIFRPTLVYGLGRDKNISEMARFIRRFGFFPLFAGGRGLRQPIHANDVAQACATVVSAASPTNGVYNLSGAGTLTYREMVISIFKALGRRPRLIPVPLWGAALAMSLLRLHPRYRHWSAAMVERMGRDLVFDHDRAARDFGFAPTAFALSADDLPATDGN